MSHTFNHEKEHKDTRKPRHDGRARNREWRERQEAQRLEAESLARGSYVEAAAQRRNDETPMIN